MAAYYEVPCGQSLETNLSRNASPLLGNGIDHQFVGLLRRAARVVLEWWKIPDASPVGVGKTFLACALGHAACRAGRRVLFLRADRMFHLLHQSRADLSTEKVFRQLLAPDLLIVDDFALRRLTSEQSKRLLANFL